MDNKDLIAFVEYVAETISQFDRFRKENSGEITPKAWLDFVNINALCSSAIDYFRKHVDRIRPEYDQLSSAGQYLFDYIVDDPVNKTIFFPEQKRVIKLP